MAGLESAICSPELGTSISHTIYTEKKKSSSCSTHMGQPPQLEEKVSLNSKVRKGELQHLASWTEERRYWLRGAPTMPFTSHKPKKLCSYTLCNTSCPSVLKQPPKRSLFLQTCWNCSVMSCPLLLKTEQVFKPAHLMQGLVNFQDDSVKSTFTLRVCLFFMLKSA